MKKYVIAAIILCVIFLSGCFQFKTISFTGKTNIDGGIKTDFAENKAENQDDEGFVFKMGKVSYTNGKKTGAGSVNAENGEVKYKTVLDFYYYVDDIKVESDKSMEIFEIPGYTKSDISEAIVKNRLILERIRRFIVPGELFKTSEGYYYAVKYGNNYLETLVSFRLKLLESMMSDLKKKSEDIQREISTLKNAVIPNKEAALKFAGQSMMEEEGYLWNDNLNKFEIKK
ncbi:MAG: hypothetical protein ACM3KR_09715 [Deltaproteobacteria bacterium]